jgi:hypothetical protein
MRSSLKLALSLVLGSLLAGCAVDVSDEDVSTAAEAMETENALTENSLTQNSLTVNSLTVNSLTVNSLTVNSLTVNSLVMDALAQPASRTVLKYIVGCALPAGAHIDLDIDGTTYGYDGQLGLAPSWTVEGGSCDSTCQSWVSSCVIARLNYYGQVVPLSVRGGALTAPPAEQTSYPNRDAVYFGNIFANPQIRYACIPDGGSLARVCGPSGAASCTGVSYVGSCSSLCDAPAADGSFANCHASAGGQLFSSAISVFLQ